MIDLSKEKVEVKCECGRKHTATFQDVINSRTIHCSCGTTIKLTDNDGSVRRSVNDMKNAFKDLENVFKGLGR